MRKTTQRDVEESQREFEGLARVLSSLGPSGAERFLRELCTPAECVDLAKRWRLVRELISGKTQRAVARELGMSLCRITRGARYVKDPESVLAACARKCAGAAKRPSAAGSRTPKPRSNT